MRSRTFTVSIGCFLTGVMVQSVVDALQLAGSGIKVRTRADIDERTFGPLLRQAVHQGPATRERS